MKNYSIKFSLIIVLFYTAIACSKEQELEITSSTVPIMPTKNNPLTKQAATKIFVYQKKEYHLLFDTRNDGIPTKASTELERAVAHTTDLTAFTFLGKDSDKTYLFDTEMQGYQYIETHIDQSSGRQLQVGHATDFLRDQLIAKYGAPPIDYTNPIIRAEAQDGINAIYQQFNIVGKPSTDVAAFMGTLQNNNAKNTNNNSWQLWEHPIQNGEVFDIETAPNVWSWTHGEWNCNITYAAMDLVPCNR
ncbi:MAG: hypothetical protein ACRBFS_24840, partial [Aureispira sp.]